MQNDPQCPVCRTRAWKLLGSRTYRPDQTGRTTPYVNKRLAVLFTVWFPGESTVTFTSAACGVCGFVCSLPRPEPKDIDAKYEYLSAAPETKNEISQTHQSDARRSADLYRRLHSMLPESSSILDFGGGNGRLLSAFIEQGHRCSLVDYSARTLPGIHYAGARLSDLPAGQKFDAIICSHVLEHLAEPGEVVAELKPRLKVSGTLYVEVPLEIWKRPPLPVEPVTHINYFTPASMRVLLERAGFDVLSCDEGLYITEEGGTGKAIRAFARGAANDATRPGPEGMGMKQTLHYLAPSPLAQLLDALKYPTLTRQNFTRRVRRHVGRLPVLWRLVATKQN